MRFVSVQKESSTSHGSPGLAASNTCYGHMEQNRHRSCMSQLGIRYCITLTDYFSKWVEAAPVPTKEAKQHSFTGCFSSIRLSTCTGDSDRSGEGADRLCVQNHKCIPRALKLNAEAKAGERPTG